MKYGIVFLFCFMIRLYMVIPILGDDHVDHIFRVGVIPLSDARGWVNGAFQIHQGQDLTSVAAYRPMYSLFLSILFMLPGASDSYRVAIFYQILLFSIVVTWAWRLLEQYQPRWMIWVFFSFLVLWRTDTCTLMMSENLGMYCLILSMAFLLNGIYFASPSQVGNGLFWFGLSQAVRPWNMISLLTVPLGFKVLHPSSYKRRYLAYYFTFALFGLGIHSLAVWIFNDPNWGSNYSFTLYGQVVGGEKGWEAVFDNPVIFYNMGKIPFPELASITYQEAWNYFLKHPFDIFKGIHKGYVSYFEEIPHMFGNHPFNIIYFVISLIIFASIDGLSFFISSIRKDKIKMIWLCGGVVLLWFRYDYGWTIMLMIALYIVIKNRKEPLIVFIILYLLGIFLSIPFVGRDGGTRVRIGSDIVLFLIISYGIGKVMSQQKAEPLYQENEIHFRNEMIRKSILVFGTLCFFIGIPYGVKASAYLRIEPNLEGINSDFIAKTLRLPEIPTPPQELEQRWDANINPLFDEINNRLGYDRIIYLQRDSVFFEKNHGITYPEKMSKLWPLSPLKIDRTISIFHNRFERFSIFPDTLPQDLRIFNKKEIIVVGTIGTRPRESMDDTAYVIVVSHIGYLNEHGQLEWKKIG